MLKVFAFLAIGLLAGSCQNATGPSPIQSPTPPGPGVLTITPAIEGLKIGSAETLTAVLVSGNGTRRTVPASWSSDAPEVAMISDDGQVRAISPGRTTIRAEFEALSAVQLMRVVPDYEGTWSGEYRIVNCTWISGAGSSYCKYAFGAVLPFRTMVTQNGASLSGTLEFYSTARELTEVGPVAGSIDDSGSLVLTGTTSSATAEQPGETKLSDWNTTLTGNGDRITGRFVKNRRFQNFFGWQESREDCEIVKIERSRPPA